jgi:hypothetical protein
MPDVMQQDPDGAWRPAIPLPFCRGRLLGQYQCTHPILGAWCGRRFRSLEAYEAHYRRYHLRGQ